MDMVARSMAKGARETAVKQASAKTTAADKRIFSLPNSTDGSLSVEGAKGKTLQNFFGTNLKTNDSSLQHVVNIVDNQFFDIPIVPNLAGPLFLYKKPPVKENAQYTVIVNVVTNTLSDVSAVRLIRPESYGVPTTGLFLPRGFTTGMFISTFTTNKSLATQWDTLSNIYLANPGVTGGIKFSMMILEGDWTNKEVPPYFEGIKSVGEAEGKLSVLSGKKNIFDMTTTPKQVVNMNNYQVDTLKKAISLKVGVVASTGRVEIPLPLLKPYTNYTFSCFSTISDVTQNPTIQIRNSQAGAVYGSSGNTLINNERKQISFTFKTDEKVLTNVFELWLYPKTTATAHTEITAFYEDIQIEQGTTVTPYEPYKESKIEIPLIEPLRSLPNGVADEIKDGKIIRRVGKKVFNGSELWNYPGTNSPGESAYFDTGSKDPEGPTTTINVISDKYTSYNADQLYSSGFSGLYGVAAEGVYGHFRVRIAKTILNDVSANGFKTWLSSNPLTIFYQLKTPIEQPITIPAINSFTNGMVTIENNLWPNELTVSYSTNVVARIVTSENTLSGVLASTLTLADKELAMKSIPSLATGATLTDAVAKINQILTIWR